MALIPADVGIRMRLQTEAQLLQPAQPIAEIAGDPPELRQGQRFSAVIQEALPENTYKAIVAGKSLTLSLPEGAKPGDALELVVVDRSNKVVIAKLANQPAGADTPSTYQYSTLSRTAQLIGTLLPAEGENAAPVALNRGLALLTQPPRGSAELAPALALAVKQSGVFYESHQAQWVIGRMPLAQLQQEPQGRLPAAPQSSAGAESAPGPRAAESLSRDAASLLQTMARLDPEVASATRDTSVAGTKAQTIPDEIRPLVQQQLDAVATQRLAWHGEVWPGQSLEWEIEWQDEGRAQPGEQRDAWITSLRLSTPRLGALEARLQLNGAGVRVALLTTDASTADELRGEIPALESSLAAAGVQLQGMMVRDGGPAE